MSYTFDPKYIRGNEIDFYIYLIVIIIIIVLTLFLVIKSIRKKKNVSK